MAGGPAAAAGGPGSAVARELAAAWGAEAGRGGPAFDVVLGQVDGGTAFDVEYGPAFDVE